MTAFLQLVERTICWRTAILSQDSVSFHPSVLLLLGMFHLFRGSLMYLLSAVRQNLLLRKKDRKTSCTLAGRRCFCCRLNPFPAYCTCSLICFNLKIANYFTSFWWIQVILYHWKSVIFRLKQGWRRVSLVLFLLRRGLRFDPKISMLMGKLQKDKQIIFSGLNFHFFDQIHTNFTLICRVMKLN